MFKQSQITAEANLWGELWVDVTGENNFEFHIEQPNLTPFVMVKRTLERFVNCIQARLVNQRKCPFYTPDILETEIINRGKKWVAWLTGDPYDADEIKTVSQALQVIDGCLKAGEDANNKLKRKSNIVG